MRTTSGFWAAWCRRRAGAGFTLVELMIAIGILAFALPLIGTAFLSASWENKASIEDTMSTIVGQNGSAIAATALRHSALNGAVGALTDVSDRLAGGVPMLPPAVRAYPVARPEAQFQQDWFTSTQDGKKYPSARFGWLVAARQPVKDANDYELQIIVYRKHARTDRPGIELKLKISGNNAEMEVPAGRQSPQIGKYVVRTALTP